MEPSLSSESRMRTAHWCLLKSPSLDGETNMAIDKWLLDERTQNLDPFPVLRFFSWDRPTVSYGRLQDVLYARRWADALGVEYIVQRPSGGGMVLHEDDLSFSLCWGCESFFSIRHPTEIYKWIHSCVRIGLKVLGVEAEYCPAPQEVKKNNLYCFRCPVEGDVLLDGQKIVGGAIRIKRKATLYQGTINLAKRYSHRQIQNAVISGFKDVLNIEFDERKASIFSPCV